MLAFSFDECRDRHNVIVTGMPKLLGGYHLWQSQDDKGELLGSKTDKRKGDLPMGKVSYTAHISNKNSSITSKSKLQGVAKHNLRKYKSDEYSMDNIKIIRGTEDLYQDVKNVYHQEFDEVIKEYNEKQKRADRKIEDYFDHVANLEQDMAVEIIFQFGDKEFWKDHVELKDRMHFVYSYLTSQLEEMLPDFKIASAVIHYDEASPHMHVVGVPVWSGAKKGLRKKVSKRNVFTSKTLADILQGKLREEAGKCFEYHFDEELKEKGKGRNHDLSVVEYKVAKETQTLDRVNKELEENVGVLIEVNQAVSNGREELKRVKNETDELLANGNAKIEKLADHSKSLGHEVSELEDRKNFLGKEVLEKEAKKKSLDEEVAILEDKSKHLDEEVSKKEMMLDIADMTLAQKEEELNVSAERMQRNLQEAETLYKKYASLPLSDRHYRSMEDMFALTQWVSELEEENRQLRGLLQKAYDFMKNFLLDGKTLLDKFLETIGERVQQIFTDKKR